VDPFRSRPVVRRYVVALAVTAAMCVVAADAVASARPAAGRAARMPGAATTPVEHVVIISKENRSFDEYFGQFPGANGATTGLMHDGTVVPLAKTPDPMPNDIKHDTNAFNTAYDKSKNDGFDPEGGAYSSTGQPLALSQMSQGQTPNTGRTPPRTASATTCFRTGGA